VVGVSESDSCGHFLEKDQQNLEEQEPLLSGIDLHPSWTGEIVSTAAAPEQEKAMSV